MAITMQDKRLDYRIRLNLPISYRVRGEGGLERIHTNDISAGGLSFIAHKFIAPATCMNMEIAVYDKMVTPIGSIAWTEPLAHSNRYRIGIKFIEFNPRDKEYLSDYIRILSDRLL